MKKLLIAIMSISFAASCSVLKNAGVKNVKAEWESEQINTIKEVPPKKPAAGDMVVAAWNSTVWTDGKLESLKDGKAEVRFEDETSPSEVELSRVFVLPQPNATISVKPGDYALVKDDSSKWWNEAEIKEVNDSVVKARLVNANATINLSAEKVVAVSLVVADIKDHAAAQNFLNDAYAHRAIAPADYQPKIGERVLGKWATNAWYPGKVKSLSAGKALIVWENGMKPDETPFEKIVHFPTAENTRTPAINDFVLLKPEGTGNWIYGQVTGASGASIEAKDVEATRSYKPGEFVVLE